jgi:hypothetical protein
MSKYWLIILAAVAVLLLVSVVLETRLAAGGGALLLIGAIIYQTVRNRTDPKGFARAERGAQELRDDLERDPRYRDE